VGWRWKIHCLSHPHDSFIWCYKCVINGSFHNWLVFIRFTKRGISKIMTHLSLSLLGPFQAWTADGVLQSFRTAKERALIAYLAVENGHLHHRETLAEMFWPERSDGVARNNLRQALYGIRQGIGESAFDVIFTITGEEVGFDLSEQVWLDLTAFHLHLKSVQQHLHVQPGPCPDCMQHLHDAVEIYRGDFLEDISLEKNQNFHEWAEFRREQFFREQTQALEALINEYEGLDDYFHAAFYMQRLVQDRRDRVNENLYRRLMTFLAKNGRTGAALEEYEICRRKVLESTSGELEEKTILLADQIREGRFDPGPLVTRPIPHNLPQQLTSFIGREMELTKINYALESSSCRLITLVGLGGVGKTRLAIQSANMNLRLFPDGVYFLPLDTVQSNSTLCEIIGRVVGLVPGAQKEMSELLLDYLRSRRVLLLLDDFEHRLDGKDQLLQILQEAPYVKILLTTRERLRFQAECLVEVNGLPYPGKMIETVDVSIAETQIQHSDALRLLFERASRVRPGLPFIKNSKEIEAALRICQAIDGLPLGIELAASWAHEYSLAQIADEVQRNLEFLQNSFQDMPERHRSLLASFEHSWDLLSESECEVFSKLAVFPGSFTVKAAQEVAGAAQPWIMRLEDKSLIRRAAYGRYTLHPLLRQYAGQKLRQYSRKIGDMAQQQHTQFFCSFLKSRELDLRGFRQAAALNEVETELENINAAWDWAIEHRAFHLIEQASLGLLFFFEARSRWQEGESLFRSALEGLKNQGTDASLLRVQAYLSAGLGWFCCRMTRFQEAEKLIQYSLQVLDDQDINFGRIFAHFALGFLYTWMSRFNEAWLHLSTSLSLSERSGDGWGLAWSREFLAEIAFESGQTGFNQEPFLETLALFERAGEQRGSSRALNYLGNIALAQDRYAEARTYFEKLLGIAEKLGDVWGAAGGYSKLGQLAAAREDYEQAWRLHQRSLTMLQRMGDQRRSAYTMRELGEIAAMLNKQAEAVDFFQQALEIASNAQSTPLIQDVLTGIATVMFRGTQKEASAELLGLVLTEPIGDKLTSNRASRLWETMKTSLPSEVIERVRAQSNKQALVERVDRLLQKGIQL
jgi:predicted ATPase/DNA-binding SARP family transcriptional activator